jgi:hypothetical protein
VRRVVDAVVGVEMREDDGVELAASHPAQGREGAVPGVAIRPRSPVSREEAGAPGCRPASSRRSCQEHGAAFCALRLRPEA